jgi:hypothetical protein
MGYQRNMPAPPYGYESHHGVLAPVASEQRALTRIRELCGLDLPDRPGVRRYSDAAAAFILNLEGHRPRHAVCWGSTTVANVRRADVYRRLTTMRASADAVLDAVDEDERRAAERAGTPT